MLEFGRLVGWDVHSTWLIALSTAWPLVVLPGVIVVMSAAYLRRRVLGGVAGLVLLVAAAWWPVWIGAAGAGPTSAAGVAGVRLLALNVEYSSDTGAAASRQGSGQ